jgi:hypothetical protein
MSAVFTGTAKATASPQYDWGYCEYCSTMFWTPGASDSACSDTNATRRHAVSSGSYNYGLYNGMGGLLNSSNPQPNWRWCTACQGLFWGGDTGICAAWGYSRRPHAPGGTSYDLYWGNGQGGQAYWRYCGLCSLLYWQGASGGGAGFCPSYPTEEQPNAIGPHSVGSATVYDIGWAGTY